MKKKYDSPEWEMVKLSFERLNSEQVVSDPQIPKDGGDDSGAGVE